MHLDNQRLQSIQRFKALIHKKMDKEEDPTELEQWQIMLDNYSAEEQRILERLDVKWEKYAKNVPTIKNVIMKTGIVYFFLNHLLKDYQNR